MLFNMISEKNEIIREKYEEIFRMMVDYAAASGIDFNKCAIASAVYERFLPIIEQMKCDEDVKIMLREFLKKNVDLFIASDSLSRNAELLYLIGCSRHPLRVKVENGKTEYYHLRDMKQPMYHALLCKVTNNDNKYTYEVFNTMTGYKINGKDVKYKDQIYKYFNMKDAIECKDQADNFCDKYDEPWKVKERKVIVNDYGNREVEVVYKETMNQKELEEKYRTGCAVSPLMHLLTDLHSQGKVKIDDFCDAIKEAMSTLNIGNIKHKDTDKSLSSVQTTKKIYSPGCMPSKCIIM
jgi:hypothetical protein